MKGKNMKLLKSVVAMVCITLLAIWPVLANLVATVDPGWTFQPDEVPTLDHLNLLGQPTITVTGTLDGSTSLAAGSVNGILLADSVPDGVTIGFNGSVPRALQTLGAGIAGKGLTNYSTTTIGINPDASLAFSGDTNHYQVGVGLTWQYNAIWQPWLVWLQSTNAPLYTNAIWGYTNVQPITNIVVSGYAGPTLTVTDQIPVLAQQQGGSNTVATLNAIAQAVDAANLKQVATLNFYGNTASNDVVTAIALTDAYGQHTCLASALAVTVSTNTTISNLVSRVAAAINGTVSTPKYTATVVQATNVYVYEPLVWYAQSGSSAQVTLTSSTSLSIVGTSANLPPLLANARPNRTTVHSGISGAHAEQTATAYALVSGGVPPYTYSWYYTEVSGASSMGTFTLFGSTSSSCYATLIYTASGGDGVLTLSCDVQDSYGQASTATVTNTFKL